MSTHTQGTLCIAADLARCRPKQAPRPTFLCTSANAPLCAASAPKPCSWQAASRTCCMVVLGPHLMAFFLPLWRTFSDILALSRTLSPR